MPLGCWVLRTRAGDENEFMLSPVAESTLTWGQWISLKRRHSITTRDEGADRTGLVT
jgi:hypothetical protein